MMENKKNILHNSSTNQKYINNYPQNHILYNSNQANSHYSHQSKNNPNHNKLHSIKTNFKADNRINPPLKSYNSNNINYIYDTNKEKVHGNNTKKYYSNNNSNISLKEVNPETKSNYSVQSNSSTKTIKTMLNLINGSGKNSDEISFLEIKCKNYPLDTSDSSRMSQEAKYMSTNYSLSHDFKYKELPIKNKVNSDPQMSLVIKQKIENAKSSEEILLPASNITLESLTINKPIIIRGQQSSCLFINNGPILIDLGNEHKNKKINPFNFVKFCQLKILYNDSEVNKDKKISTLFKLHPGALLELEDCDIGYQKNSKKKSNSEKKSVAFLLSSNKLPENNDNNTIHCQNTNSLNSTILNITNTRIHDFFQSIRSGQNCIVNITKSAFLQNCGKAIVMINPITLKINETFFQNNMDNAVHVKFIIECLYEEKRKIFINKSEFENTLGNHVCIEGIKTDKLDLSLVLTKNKFAKSNTDGVLAYDLLYNFFEVGNNIFKKNQGNGLFIQKAYYNGVFLSLNKNIYYQPIKIKDNRFLENRGFGLFINNCIIEVISNRFETNRQSGLFLCNLSIDEPKQGFDGIQKTNNNFNNNLIEDDFSVIIKEVKRTSSIINNSFCENLENGLYIFGYPYCLNLYQNVFCRNFRNGLTIDLDSLYNKNDNNKNSIILNTNTQKFNHDFNSLLTEYKLISNKSTNDLVDVNINNCVIEKNKKTGISLNSCFVYCEESFIINNLDYAISIKKKEYQHCFKSGKKNVISGAIGGEWGQIELGNEGCCFFCMGSEKMDLRKKEDILNKIPTYLNDSSFEEDVKEKCHSYDLNKNKNNNQLEKKGEDDLSGDFDKSLAQSEKNKNVKSIKKNHDNKECFIF